jgi:hypothetical protein
MKQAGHAEADMSCNAQQLPVDQMQADRYAREYSLVHLLMYGRGFSSAAGNQRVRPGTGRLLVVFATSCKLHAGYKVCKIAFQLDSMQRALYLLHELQIAVVLPVIVAVCAIAVLVRSFASVHRKLLQLVSQACIAYRHNKCTRYLYRLAAHLTIIVPACVFLSIEAFDLCVLVVQ